MQINNPLKKSLAVAVILLFIGMTIAPLAGSKPLEKSSTSSLDRATIYVDDDFNESTPGWNVTHFDTILRGVTSAEVDDSIFVYNGLYGEGYIDINRSMTLTGENKETTVIDGGYDLEVIWVETDGITISSFTLRNADIGLFGKTNNSIVSDNIFSCPQAGIGLSNSSNNQIFDNTVVSGYEVGIAFLYSSNKNVVSDNIIRNTYVGVFLAGSCNFNKISSNTIKQCYEYGIWIYWSFLNFVNKNNFMDNGCSAYFENSSFILWWGNYWDDWSSSRPRPINGTRYGPLLKTTDPWTTYDWRPATEPYDIGV